MSPLSLKTVANQCFGVPFDGGPTVAKISFGGPEIGLNTVEPSITPASPGLK